ncbi:hypothetical protein CCP3SC5AM1_150004 [Gammaproteobacteria bacterium]
MATDVEEKNQCHFLNDPDFQASHIFAELQSAPLGFIDIGSRGGVRNFVNAIAQFAAVLAFEPDPQGIMELNDSLADRYGFAVVENIAVGGFRGRGELNLYAHGVNHSLLKASHVFRDRYRVSSLEYKGSLSVEVDTLDAILFEY